MPARLTKSGEELELDLSSCKGSEFNDALAKIREVPGRRFDFDRKIWCVPAEPTVAERVIYSIMPTVSTELMDWVKEGRVKEQQALTTPLPDDAKLLVPWALARTEFQPEFIQVGDEQVAFTGLMQHQRPMVDLAAANKKLIIADDMGLGKTGEAISAIEEWRLRQDTKPSGPRLVVCPNSVKGSWVKQLKLWLGRDGAYQAIDAGTATKRHAQLESVALSGEDAWAIVNWEQLRVHKVKKTVHRRNGCISKRIVEEMKEPLFESAPWIAVVADEAHRAKNRKAAQTRGLWRTRADDGLMLAMTGTPLMNSPDELWAILKWLWPKEYTSYWRFYEQYVEYTEGYFGKTIVGVKNPDALRFELNGRLARRTQGQVLDLPGKVRIPIPLELNRKQRKLYDEAERALWIEIAKSAAEGDTVSKKLLAADSYSQILRIPNGAARTVRLRQILESPANLGGDDDSAILDAAVDKVMDSRPEPWVVFTEFVPTTELLATRLRAKGLEVAVYNGSVSTQERSEIEDNFQAGRIDVIVGTIMSLYQGITLTNSNRQFWCSRSWVPAINEQGEDRENRIGQTDRVFVYIAQPENTVATSKVEPLNRLKERIVKTVITKDEIDVGV